MEVLNSYYPVLYRCPVVKLGGYAAQNRLRGEILAYLDFGGATGSAKDGLAESMLALATERGDLAPARRWWRPAAAPLGRRWPWPAG